MKILLQRVSHASVTVGEHVVGHIGPGLLLFVGVERGDTEAESHAAAEKIATLRVFSDPAGKMNLDVRETGGSLLVISQFTLAGSTRRGRRPSFDGAAPPETARAIVDHLVQALRSQGLRVETGIFGADMKVELLNDGPVTFLVEFGPPSP